MSCNFFQQKLLLLELGEISGGIFYSALTNWSLDMKRQNGRDRFQKTERATSARSKMYPQEIWQYQYYNNSVTEFA